MQSLSIDGMFEREKCRAKIWDRQAGDILQPLLHIPHCLSHASQLFNAAAIQADCVPQQLIVPGQSLPNIKVPHIINVGGYDASGIQAANTNTNIIA